MGRISFFFVLILVLSAACHVLCRDARAPEIYQTDYNLPKTHSPDPRIAVPSAAGFKYEAQKSGARRDGPGNRG